MTQVHLQVDELLIPDMTDDEFLEFCVQNRDHRIERTADGKVIVMSATGGETGDQNSEISFQLRGWAKRDGRGMSFDSSTGFRLPNSAVRAPDAAWVSRLKTAPLTKEQRKRFLPFCPDFVIELTSPSDRLPEVKLKMTEYMANGCQLGWLVDPATQRVIIYRSGGQETLEKPAQLVGEGPVAGFVLDLTGVWEPEWS